MPTDDADAERLEAAVERLTDASRFAEAEAIVARVAPQCAPQLFGRRS